MTDSAFEARIQRIVRKVLDTRIDLLGIMLAEDGVDDDTARDRLTRLVHALRNPRIEPTIFSDGRRLPMTVDGDQLVLNRELLERVGDLEILAALARPVTQITELPSVGLTLAFEIDDDQSMRDMTTKVQRRAGSGVRASAISGWVQYRVETLVERLGRLCGNLGRASVFSTSGTEELSAAVLGAAVWPEWADIRDVAWCARAVSDIRDALEGSRYEPLSDTLAELTWDSLVLSTQSFIRHAGRILRNLGGDVPIAEVLNALANAVRGDEEFSTDVADWPAYADIFEAWQDLNRQERAMFGPVLLSDVTPAASVLLPARRAFGLDRPAELPWREPLVCWTAREQRALRDLLIGFYRTLPGYSDHAIDGQRNHDLGTEPPLDPGGERRMLGVQVVALASEAGLLASEDPRRCWSSCVRRLVEQFRACAEPDQHAVIEHLRAAYDTLFPDAQAIWARRLYELDTLTPQERFTHLCTAINDVFHAPAFFDPFLDPASHELAPIPTVVIPVGVTAPGKVPFFVPMVALTATLRGAPLRIRAVDVPTLGDAPCRWVCDRGLHLAKLSQQPVELIARAVRGDALQMAVFDT